MESAFLGTLEGRRTFRLFGSEKGAARLQILAYLLCTMLSVHVVLGLVGAGVPRPLTYAVNPIHCCTKIGCDDVDCL